MANAEYIPTKVWQVDTICHGSTELQVLTQWFEKGVPPEYKGVYEITVQPHVFPIGQGEWNGVIWINPDTGNPLLIQRWHWRGLADKP